MKFNKSHAYKKMTGILLSVFVFVSFFATPLLAWEDNNQHKSNEMSGLGVNKTVILTKYARQENNELTLLKDAEFKLYKDLDTPLQVGGIYKTNAHGQIVIDDLEPGDYYFLETKPPIGFDYDRDASGDPIKKYEFNISSAHDEHIVNVKAYNIPVVTDLIIHKQIENQDNSEITVAQKDIDFEFKVTFGDGGTYKYTIDGGPEIALTSGETLKLKHEQKAVFKDLPYGLKYKVVELYSGKYMTSTINNEGNIGEQDITAAFTNSIDKEVYLEFSKEVENKDDSELTDDQLTMLERVLFDFTVTFHRIDEEGQRVEAGPFHYVIDNGDTVSNEIRIDSGGVIKLHHNETARFIDMPAGIYYTIIEDPTNGYLPTISNIKGVTRIASEYNGDVFDDKSLVHQFVNIIDDNIQDGLGRLKITKSIYGDIEAIHHEDLFTFEIIFTDNALVTDDTNYNYSIDGVDQGPLREPGEISNKVTIKPGQVVEIKDIPSGTRFLVKESAHPDYSQIVEEVNGIIVTDKASTVKFMNVLDGDHERLGDLKVTKKVNGHTTDKKFTIHVSIDGEDHEILLGHDESKIFEDLPAGAAYIVSEEDYSNEDYITVIENGQGFIAEGNEVEVVVTNHYTPPEMITIKGEKTWDLSANPDQKLPDNIEVELLNGDEVVAIKTVTPNAEGKWLYEFEVVKYDEENNLIDYTIKEKAVNGYRSEVADYNIKNTLVIPAELQIPVEKQLSGDTPKDTAQFGFEMIGVHQEPVPNNQQVVIEGEGVGEFDAIKFVEAGTYRYKIYELNTRLEGYQYDKTIFEVTVVVKSEENRMVIDSVEIFDTKENKVVDEIVFENIYKEIDVPEVDPKPKPNPKPEKEPPLVPEKTPDTSATQTLIPYVVGLIIGLIALRYVLFKRKKDNDFDEKPKDDKDNGRD